VSAIIGDGCSSATKAILPLANADHIPLISPSASSPSLSIPDDYLYRVVPPDTLQGEYIAKVIYQRGLKNVAVFYTDEPYGTGIKDVFAEKFKALGGKIVAVTTAKSDVITLADQVKTLAAAKPDALFIAPNSTTSAVAIMQQYYNTGNRTAMFGADILYDTTIIQNAPLASEGLTVTSFPTGSQSFKQALANEYQVTDQLYGAAQAYDAFHAIYLTTKAGASNGEQIKDKLKNLSFTGVSGAIAFDKNGEISDPSYTYDLLQVKDGAFAIIE
jgi:branched-chain amino acid transport system substrate-binding protein